MLYERATEVRQLKLPNQFSFDDAQNRFAGGARKLHPGNLPFDESIGVDDTSPWRKAVHSGAIAELLRG